MSTIFQKHDWLRVPAAILVAFIASFAWLILYYFYFGFVGAYGVNLILGFTGVFFGSLCVGKQDRVLCAIILLMGGLSIDGFFEDSDDKVYPLSVVWVALGGLAAVAFYYWRRPPTSSPEPTVLGVEH